MISPLPPPPSSLLPSPLPPPPSSLPPSPPSPSSFLPSPSLHFQSCAEVALQCLCDLVTSLSHFNFRSNILAVLVPRMNSTALGGKVKQESCTDLACKFTSAHLCRLTGSACLCRLTCAGSVCLGRLTGLVQPAWAGLLSWFSLLGPAYCPGSACFEDHECTTCAWFGSHCRYLSCAVLLLRSCLRAMWWEKCH